jgi:cobalt-zinc-cadmium efflux system outer membrane protein
MTGQRRLKPLRLLPLLFLPWIPGAVPTAPAQQRLALEESGVDLADGLSPREAVALALKRNRQLLAIRESRAIAQGGVVEAKALPDPELRTGRLDFDDDSASIWRLGYNVAVRWSPPRLGERRLNGNRASGKVAEMEAEIAVAEQKIAAEVRLLHTNLVFLDEQIKLAEASVKVREQIVAFITEQVEAGARDLVDQNVAELALADARAIPAAYQLERRLTLARLAAELDLPQPAELRIQVEGEPLVFHGRSPEGPAPTAAAFSNRPELASLSARCSQANAMLTMKKRERYPWLSFVQVSREFRRGDGSDAWGFRFGLDLPISKWRRGIFQTPSAKLEQCRSEIGATKARISLEVGQLLERLRSGAEDLEYYRQKIEPLAARAVELSELAVAAGRADLRQRLTEEAQRLSQRRTYLTKLLDYRRLEIELDQALGNAIPR